MDSAVPKSHHLTVMAGDTDEQQARLPELPLETITHIITFALEEGKVDKFSKGRLVCRGAIKTYPPIATNLANVSETIAKPVHQVIKRELMSVSDDTEEALTVFLNHISVAEAHQLLKSWFKLRSSTLFYHCDCKDCEFLKANLILHRSGEKRLQKARCQVKHIMNLWDMESNIVRRA